MQVWLCGKAQNAGNSGTIVKFCNTAAQPEYVSGNRVGGFKQVLNPNR